MRRNHAAEVYPRMQRSVCVGALLLMAATIGPASDGPEVGPPRVVCEMPGLQSCRFLSAEAPGGPALVCGRLNEAAFTWDIIRVPIDGGGEEPTVIGYGREPDVRGSKLAWVGTEPGREGVWLDDLADDAPPVRLTDSLEMTQPSISADGQTVACTRRTKNRDGIYLLRAGQADPERLAWRDERQPVWGPVGAQMLAIKTDQLWLLQAPRWQELVSERLTDEGMVHFDPAWGPGGRWITFAAGWTVDNAHMALMDLSGRRIWWPNSGVSGVRSPVISPDGKLLAFVAGESGTVSVYVCELRLPQVHG